MNGCIYRTEDGKCKQFSVGGILSFCYLDGTCDCKIQSNADRTRAMSDEELVDKFIYGAATYACPPNEAIKGSCTEGKDCRECWLAWLKSPVEPGEEDNGT